MTPSVLRDALIILQQPLDVIEFDLRALRIGEAAAEFFQNAANPLHVDFAGDLHRVIVTVFVSAQRPSERIGAIGTALLPADAIAGAIALSLIALLHRLRETLGALAQRIQRAALRIHGAIGVPHAGPAAGLAHRGTGFAEAVLAPALLGVLARLPLLTLLAALALSHTALGKLLLQLLEPFTQAILILLQIAHALIALLAAHAIASRILALLEGLVAQLLLLADHVTKFVQRLPHLVIAGLTGLRHLQVFQHLLQLFEQLPGGVLVAGARQPLHALDHVVEILLAQHAGIGIERPRQLLGIVAQLLGELAHEIIQRGAQVLGELLDLFVAGAAFQRLLERLLRGTQGLVHIGDVAILDDDRERPQAADDLAHGVVGAGGLQLPRDAEEAEVLCGVW